MKNKTSTLNRLFSKFFSVVLLSAVSLAPAISPAVTASEVIEPKAPPMFFMPPTTTTVSNATPIVIGDNSTNPNTVPYPSNITIAGAVGTITNVTVVLRGLSIGRPRDLDILLVSPTGQALILVSDVAGVTEPNSTTTNVTITLADGSPSLPGDVIGTTPLVTGTFRPTNNGAGEAAMPAPAPALTTANYPPASTDAGSTACAGCTQTFASKFAQPGVAANGVWSLYVDDDSLTGTTGTMAQGWTLNVTTDNIPTTAAGANVSGRVVNSDGRGISGVKIGMLEPNGQTRYALSNPFGYFNFADVPAGEVYVFSVKAKGYQPTSVARAVTEDVADLEIVLHE
ncbi:MAG TPA: carboxypeptidase-like regulatory domain-containing protein [Pyrinomonadaceae bacterium]|jgi:subtilisin-like proprotein convertase family protein